MENFWNERYAAADFAYGTAPNRFLAQQLNRYQPFGRALFAAEGEGRNAVYAAARGLAVEAFDLSEEGRKKAVRLAQERNVTIDYRVGDFRQLGYLPETYDLLALIYAHFPPASKKAFNKELASFVKTGGLVVFEAFGSHHLPLRTANPAVGGPGVPEMLFSVAEIEQTFPDFDVRYLAEEQVELDEGIYHQGTGSVVRFVGRKQ